MEGGSNPKKMARSKRASSQRSKAKHSRHTHGSVPAGTREKAAGEAALPSNWERYGDESGSDENDAAPLAEGEVRPKSKGADYSELLSSDMPKLFEDPPEPGGMMAMLLSNGLGLWDWDSSYLELASSTSEQQAAREASALLTVDLRLLGKSLARLNIAERLFLEDELFPKQDHVEERRELLDTRKRISESGGDAAAIADRAVHEHGDPLHGSRVGIGNVRENPESSSLSVTRVTNLPDNSRLDYCGNNEPETASMIAGDNSRLGGSYSRSPLFNTGESVTVSPHTVNNTREPTVEMRKGMEIKGSTDPFGMKGFEAAAAEAELDDLLDMLDNQAAGISLGKGNQATLTSSPASNLLSSSIPTTSSMPNPRLQTSWIESGPREVTSKSELETGLKYTGLPSDSGRKVEESIPCTSIEATDTQDDDFDSWLDSI